jgi:SAM-dependent methyltransferase
MIGAWLNCFNNLIMRESTLFKNSTPSFNIDSWYQTQLGQTVFKIEQQQIQYLPRAVFNDHLLQLGANTHPFLALNTPISHLFLVSENKTLPCSSNIVQSAFAQLPFPNDSIHTIILPHVLEWQRDPKTILADVWRVLEPDGHLIILNFNPYSLSGLAQMLGKPTLNLPNSIKWHSTGKLSHWLNSLGAEIILKRSFLFAPTNTLPNMEKALTWLFPNNGDISLIVAKKRLIPLTPLRVRWNWRELFANKPLTETAAGSVQRG